MDFLKITKGHSYATSYCAIFPVAHGKVIRGKNENDLGRNFQVAYKAPQSHVLLMEAEHLPPVNAFKNPDLGFNWIPSVFTSSDCYPVRTSIAVTSGIQNKLQLQ